jgi:hypothetical protein
MTDEEIEHLEGYVARGQRYRAVLKPRPSGAR